MSQKKQRINFVQTEFTPHGADFIAAFNTCLGATITPWYRQDHSEIYGFGAENVVKGSTVRLYGSKRGTIKMLSHAIKSKNQYWLIGGWNNAALKILIFIQFALKRKFGIWVDVPNRHEESLDKSRKLLYFMLRHSRAQVFCVGARAVESMRKLTFSTARLVNLRITMEPRTIPMSVQDVHLIRRRFNIEEEKYLITTGSRLVYEKGFDVLIDAVAEMDTETRESLRVIIVGIGDQRENLDAQIEQNGLDTVISIFDWLEPEEFRDLVGASDIVIHPSRIDSYGGPTVVALAEGVPVIGSLEAGAVVDIVSDGSNGKHFESGDVAALRDLIELALSEKEMLERWRREMQLLSSKEDRTPTGMARILLASIEE